MIFENCFPFDKWIANKDNVEYIESYYGNLTESEKKSIIVLAYFDNFDINTISFEIFKFKNYFKSKYPNDTFNIEFIYVYDGYLETLENREDLGIIDATLFLSGDHPLTLTEKDKSFKVSYNHVIKANQKLKPLVEKIKNSSFSNLEKLFIIHDYVTDFIYEENDDDPFASRSYAEMVLLGKGVCVAYADLFERLVRLVFKDNPDIYAEMFSVVISYGGHAVDVVKLKDDKYGVSGYYYVDCTFDKSKKDQMPRCVFSFIPLNNFGRLSNMFTTLDGRVPCFLNALANKKLRDKYEFYNVSGEKDFFSREFYKDYDPLTYMMMSEEEIKELTNKFFDWTFERINKTVPISDQVKLSCLKATAEFRGIAKSDLYAKKVLEFSEYARKEYEDEFEKNIHE